MPVITILRMCANFVVQFCIPCMFYMFIGAIRIFFHVANSAMYFFKKKLTTFSVVTLITQVLTANVDEQNTVQQFQG